MQKIATDTVTNNFMIMMFDIIITTVFFLFYLYEVLIVFIAITPYTDDEITLYKYKDSICIIIIDSVVNNCIRSLCSNIILYSSSRPPHVFSDNNLGWKKNHNLFYVGYSSSVLCWDPSSRLWYSIRIQLFDRKQICFIIIIKDEQNDDKEK